jgi:diguanylate cyclase (GGDEF)-like protein
MKKKGDNSSFDLNLIRLMTHLYNRENFSDEVIDLFRELDMEYKSLLKKNIALEEMANTDAKTGLLKYRDDYLLMILKTASRYVDSAPDDIYTLACVRFDIDDFTAINNRYGHDIGDIVLNDLAGVLKKYSRPTDYVIRYGGEEFDVILPATERAGVNVYMDKIFNAVDGLKYNINGLEFGITVSAGISFLSIENSRLKKISPEEINREYLLIQKLADNALYHAKLCGKHQYRFFSDTIDYCSIRERYSSCKTVAVQ